MKFDRKLIYVIMSYNRVKLRNGQVLNTFEGNKYFAGDGTYSPKQQKVSFPCSNFKHMTM